MENIASGDNLEADVGELYDLLLVLGRRGSLRAPLRTHMIKEMELSPPQLQSLLWLGHDGPLTMGELARLNGITEKSTTGVVDRLEREGLAERVRDTADRRVIRVRLTDKGLIAHHHLNVHVREYILGLLGRLDSTDRRDLFRILRNLISTRAAEGSRQGAES